MEQLAQSGDSYLLTTVKSGSIGVWNGMYGRGTSVYRITCQMRARRATVRTRTETGDLVLDTKKRLLACMANLIDLFVAWGLQSEA